MTAILPGGDGPAGLPWPGKHARGYIPKARFPLSLRQLLTGLATLLATALCVVGLFGFARHHIPVVLRDAIGLQLPFLQGEPLGAVLLRTHVDHILAFQRLLSWLDLRVFNGDPWASLAANLLACLGLALLSFQAARQSGLPAAPALLAGLTMLTGLLWLANGFNLFWGMQTHFFLAPLFTLAAGLLLACQPSPRRAAAALLLAALGALTSGSGLVGLIALALLAALLRLPGQQRHLVPLALLAILAAALWLRSLTHDAARHDPLSWLGQPLLLLDFLRLYLANPARLALRPLLPPYQAGLFASLALGLLLLVLAWSWLRLLRPGARPSPLASAGQLLCLIALGSGLATALMRLQSGELGAAEAQRYVTTQILFWVGMLLLALDWAGRAKPAWRTLGAAALAALFGLLLVGQSPYWEAAETRRSFILQATAAVISGSQDNMPWGRFHPNREHLRRAFDLMRAERTGFFAWPEADWIGAPATTLGREVSECRRYILSWRRLITRDGNLAWVGQFLDHPKVVLLLDPEGRIALFSWPARGLRYSNWNDIHEWGVEFWMTEEQQQNIQIVALFDGQLCPVQP